MKNVEIFKNILHGFTSKISITITCLSFVLLLSFGLFLSNISFTPYVAKHFLFSRIIADSGLNKSLVIAVYSLSSAIPSGLIFGLVAGLWGGFKSLKTSFLLGLSAIVVLSIQGYLSLDSVNITVEKYRFYWTVKFVEAIVFLSIFISVAMGVNKISARISSTGLKRIVAISILVLFFLLLNINTLFI